MMTVHLSLGGSGPDATAWVSAGAAVVQAIGAIVAIWYSGKLARDAAAREIAADAANERRIAEANAAAEEQRRLDREQEADRRAVAEAVEFNSPLLKAADLGDGALADLRISLEAHKNRIINGDRTHFGGDVRSLHQLARQLLPGLLEAALSARSAAAIRELETALRFPPAGMFDQSDGWVPELERAITKVERAVARVRHELKPVPRSPDLATP